MYLISMVNYLLSNYVIHSNNPFLKTKHYKIKPYGIYNYIRNWAGNKDNDEKGGQFHIKYIWVKVKCDTCYFFTITLPFL